MIPRLTPTDQERAYWREQLRCAPEIVADPLSFAQWFVIDAHATVELKHTYHLSIREFRQLVNELLRACTGQEFTSAEFTAALADLDTRGYLPWWCERPRPTLTLVTGGAQ